MFPDEHGHVVLLSLSTWIIHIQDLSKHHTLAPMARLGGRICWITGQINDTVNSFSRYSHGPHERVAPPTLLYGESISR
jgi:hypothetical protein